MRIEREQDDADVRQLGRDPTRDLDAGESGHPVVEHDRVRREGVCETKRLGTVLRFADHLDVAFDAQDGLDRFAHRGVIVGDEHFHLRPPRGARY